MKKRLECLKLGFPVGPFFLIFVAGVKGQFEQCTQEYACLFDWFVPQGRDFIFGSGFLKAVFGATSQAARPRTPPVLPGGILVLVVLSHWPSGSGVVGRKVFKSVGFLPEQFGDINFFGGRNWLDKPWGLGEFDFSKIFGEIGVRNPLPGNFPFSR